MKLNSNYLIKNVLDSDILIDLKSNFNGVIKLNKTSKDIINLVIKGYERQQIIDELTNKYNVDKETLTNDVNSFINEMINKGIINE